MDGSPTTALETLRARIDSLDDQLAALLQERIGVVKEVAALKAQHWPNTCHIRSGREGQMHQRIAKKFSGSAFPTASALAIWRQIIGASTHVESPLRIYANRPEHEAMALAYFGVQAQIVEENATLRIVVREALLAAEPGWMIFACLPVIAGDDEPQVFALAQITPEPSGDDISYFHYNGTLHVVDGFVDSMEGADWLGSHPRPIAL